jgi:hypothetical protein
MAWIDPRWLEAWIKAERDDPQADLSDWPGAYGYIASPTDAPKQDVAVPEAVGGAIAPSKPITREEELRGVRRHDPDSGATKAIHRLFPGR